MMTLAIITNDATIAVIVIMDVDASCSVQRCHHNNDGAALTCQGLLFTGVVDVVNDGTGMIIDVMIHWHYQISLCFQQLKAPLS